ncbi:hypothetical protein [Haloferula sp. BvORR071]|uniref:hypothetical protein n=1 Tax=Haloferula sp. BvORR071 TaxID=1396141 RepID=UPI002240FFC4|nr:hypothetical protein [Haloferula sp. BvORR071]
MNRFVRIAVAVLGCLHLCGGQWGALQVVAWTKMIVDYSAQDGLAEGAAKTFDGAHPCCMCKAIAEGKKQESKEQNSKAPLAAQNLALKECVLGKPIVVPPPVTCEATVVVLPDFASNGAWVGYRPPVPPPRLAA